MSVKSHQVNSRAAKPARAVEGADSQGPDVLFPVGKVSCWYGRRHWRPPLRGDTEQCGKVELIENLRGVLLVAPLTFRTPWILLSFRNT